MNKSQTNGGAVVDVVAALVRRDDRYLVARRAEGKVQAGKWEFPGGKIEPGESPAEALARECREELAVEVENARVVDVVTHAYPEKTIRLALLACSTRPGSEPRAIEHREVRWVTRAEMDDMDFSAADREFFRRL